MKTFGDNHLIILIGVYPYFTGRKTGWEELNNLPKLIGKYISQDSKLISSLVMFVILHRTKIK